MKKDVTSVEHKFLYTDKHGQIIYNEVRESVKTEQQQKALGSDFA